MPVLSSNMSFLQRFVTLTCCDLFLKYFKTLRVAIASLVWCPEQYDSQISILPIKTILAHVPLVSLYRGNWITPIAFSGSRISQIRCCNQIYISFLFSYWFFRFGGGVFCLLGFCLFVLKPNGTLPNIPDRRLDFDRFKTVDFTACGSLNINQMQKETLLEVLGWHWQSNDPPTNVLCTAVFVIYIYLYYMNKFLISTLHS